MEREQELRKLITVLHRTVRSAMRLQWMGAGEAEARFAVAQYNKILARLGELDPTIKSVFEPLAEDSPLTVVAMASRQIVSYYEDEVRGEGPGWDFGMGFGMGCGPRHGRGMPKDIPLEELGNWIRDFMQDWGRRERERRAERKHCG